MRELFAGLKLQPLPKAPLPPVTVVTASDPTAFKGNRALAAPVTPVTSRHDPVTAVTTAQAAALPEKAIINNTVTQVTAVTRDYIAPYVLLTGNDSEERAAVAQFDGSIPAEWIEGWAHLQTMPRPADMPCQRWEQIIDDAGLFLDRWAVEALALGWGTLDVFGIHEAKPYRAIHCSGLVALIGGNTVTALTADTCSIRHTNGVINRYFRRKAQPGQIPLWELRHET